MDAGEVESIHVPAAPVGRSSGSGCACASDLHPAPPARLGRVDSERRPGRQQVRADRAGHRAVADRAGRGHDSEPRAVRHRRPDVEDERDDRHRQHARSSTSRARSTTALRTIIGHDGDRADAASNDVGDDAKAILASGNKVSARPAGDRGRPARRARHRRQAADRRRAVSERARRWRPMPKDAMANVREASRAGEGGDRRASGAKTGR